VTGPTAQSPPLPVVQKKAEQAPPSSSTLDRQKLDAIINGRPLPAAKQ
jgi:hypothetical protein